MKVTVLGAGAWGTTCALLAASNGHQVTLWCKEPHVATSINASHKNDLFLPGVALPRSIAATTSLEQALGNELIFLAIPVPFIREILTQSLPFKRASHLWCSLSKGIEEATLLFPTDIIKEILGKRTHVTVLSGPSFAREVANNEPTIVTIASKNRHFCEKVKAVVETSTFCCSASSDLQGTQCAGALKNVIALGSGLFAGAGYHCNTQVFFLMSCLREIEQLITAVGGHSKTAYGPAGIGDLMLTCFSKESRNFSYGFEYGLKKKSPLTKESTVEGLNTLSTLQKLTQKYQLSLPLCSLLIELFQGHKTIEHLVAQLIHQAKGA